MKTEPDPSQGCIVDKRIRDHKTQVGAWLANLGDPAVLRDNPVPAIP